MFFEFKHGGHALTKEAAEAAGAPRREGPPHGPPRHGRGRENGRDRENGHESGHENGRGRGWGPRCWPRHVVTPEQAGDGFDPDTMTPFRYMIETDRAEDLLPVGLETVRALDALGEAMAAVRPPARAVDDPDVNPDSAIPPVFTYWSQFIDHELTARTDRDESVSDITVDDAALKPADRRTVERALLNRRTPALELDCVYGDGPPGRLGRWLRHRRERNLALARRLRDGARMRVGTAEVVTDPQGRPVGAVPPREDDLERDLPRIGVLLAAGVVRGEDFPETLRDSPTFEQRAFIGDPRNDENLVVAQFHVAMLRFHNAVVDWLQADDPHRDGRDVDGLFEDARRIVRWTFQWLTVNQFLRTLLRPDVLDRVLAEGAPLYRRRLGDARGPYMPIEFSAACYRFGHSMVRNVYDYNRNFGRQEGAGQPLLPTATLDLLFLFTGQSRTPFDPSRESPPTPPTPKVLPHNWIIEWDRFDGSSPRGGDDGQPARFARKIDTQLAPRLGDMPNEGAPDEGAPEGAEEAERNARFLKLLKHLARRNLRRGYQLSLPTGQALAREIGVRPLTRDEVGGGDVPGVRQALEQGGFLDRTPLWFYVLKEAEVREGGRRLGEVGSRVVAETFVGVLLADPESYLSQARAWNPSQPTPRTRRPVELPDGRAIATIHDLLVFAGVAG